MCPLLVALLLAQEPDLLGDDDAVPVMPAPTPHKRDDAPLVIPPPDGPVPPGVPVAEEPVPFVEQKAPPDETRKRLLAERQRMFDQMPSLGPTAIVSVAGGVGLFLGVALAVMGSNAAIGGSTRGDPLPFFIGVPLSVLGLAGLVGGLVWGREQQLMREPFFARIDEIDQELGW